MYMLAPIAGKPLCNGQIWYAYRDNRVNCALQGETSCDLYVRRPTISHFNVDDEDDAEDDDEIKKRLPAGIANW